MRLHASANRCVPLELYSDMPLVCGIKSEPVIFKTCHWFKWHATKTIHASEALQPENQVKQLALRVAMSLENTNLTRTLGDLDMVLYSCLRQKPNFAGYQA